MIIYYSGPLTRQSVLLPQFSEGINNDTEDDVQEHHIDEQEKREVHN